MKVEQSFAVAHPPDAVWAALGRPAEIAGCMPGAEVTEADETGRIAGRLNVKLGPIQAAFKGEARSERDDAARRGVMRGAGSDGKSGSRAKGELTYAVAADADGRRARVDVVVDFALTGALAQFSRGGIVDDLARRLTSEFARNLEARLDAEAKAAPPPAPEPAAALDAGSLVAATLWARIKAFLRRVLGGGNG